jgi:hypothetical protein
MQNQNKSGTSNNFIHAQFFKWSCCKCFISITFSVADPDLVPRSNLDSDLSQKTLVNKVLFETNKKRYSHEFCGLHAALTYKKVKVRPFQIRQDGYPQPF